MTLASEPAVVILSEASHALGRRIADAIGAKLHGARARTAHVDIAFDETRAHLTALFSAGQPIVAVMASGALIRMLAPLLADKHTEPAVVAVSEDGASVVPLLGGHHGANDLARTIAAAFDAHAAVTTAGDVKFGVALDQPPEGYVLSNPADAKAVMAELVAGAKAQLVISSPQRGEGGAVAPGKGAAPDEAGLSAPSSGPSDHLLPEGRRG